MLRVRSLALLALLGAPLAAQSLLEPFRYPPGTNVPNWREERGDWRIVGLGVQTYVQCDVSQTLQFLSRDKLGFANGVVEARLVKLPLFNRRRLAGVFARGHFGATTLRYVTAFAADKNGDGRYDTFVAGEVPGQVKSAVLPRPTAEGIVRLLVFRGVAIARLDTDLDGIWDLSLTVRLQSPAPAAGKTGLLGAGAAALDDWHYYDGVLFTEDQARIGTRYDMHLWATIAGTPVLRGYVCGSAFFAEPRVPLTQTNRFIPILPDALTVLSLLGLNIFLDYTGFLNPQGMANPHIRVPAEAALVGVGFHTTFVTLSDRAPDGIASIGNNLFTRIVP